MERAELIEEYLHGADRVRRAWESAPGEWSPHESMIHLADADVNGYLRFRMLVAEPGSAVPGYDQDAWVDGLGYAAQDTESALQLMTLVRQTTYPILAGLAQEAWAHTVTHSERGPWTMDEWLATYTDHVDAHLTQMEAAVAAWRENQEIR